MPGPILPRVGTLGLQDANAVDIDGGAIDGTPIGANSTSTIKATSVKIGTSVANPSTALLLFSGNVPQFFFEDTAQGANNRLWDFISYTGQFFGRVIDDANTVGVSWISVGRSGVAITYVEVPMLTIGSGGTAFLKSATYTAAMSASILAGAIGTVTVTATGVAAGDTFAIEIPQQTASLVLAGVRGGTDQILVDFYNADLLGAHSLSGTVKLRSFEV